MRSVETLDGHSEFLASLEHAAIVHYTSSSYFSDAHETGLHLE